jgi:hypothetical protein
MAKNPKSDAVEEAAEKPQERKLTALGRATLQRMKRKFGEEDGETKFYAAIRSGTLSRASMMQK